MTNIMQYPESSQRTRIEDETADSCNSSTPSSGETTTQKQIDARKQATPNSNVPRAKVSSFLATVLRDWPPQESPSRSPSPSPTFSADSSLFASNKPSSGLYPESNYELTSRSGYGSRRDPSTSTDMQLDSPISSSSDSGYDHLSDYSEYSSSYPPSHLRMPLALRGRRESKPLPLNNPGHASARERGHRLSVGSIDSSASWGSVEAEKSDASPPKKSKKKSKMHQCEICGKWFPRPSGLRTHINTHTKARPYACWIPGCNKSFAARSNAKRHLLTHGIDTSSKGKGGNSYLLDFTTPTVLESPTQSSDEARWHGGNLRWMSPESATTDVSGSPISKTPELLV